MYETGLSSLLVCACACACACVCVCVRESERDIERDRYIERLIRPMNCVLLHALYMFSFLYI